MKRLLIMTLAALLLSSKAFGMSEMLLQPHTLSHSTSSTTVLKFQDDGKGGEKNNSQSQNKTKSNNSGLPNLDDSGLLNDPNFCQFLQMLEMLEEFGDVIDVETEQSETK